MHFYGWKKGLKLELLFAKKAQTSTPTIHNQTKNEATNEVVDEEHEI